MRKRAAFARGLAMLVLLVAGATAEAQQGPSGKTDGYVATRNVASRDTTVLVRTSLELDVRKAAGRITIRTWAKQAVRIRLIGDSVPYELGITPEALVIRSNSTRATSEFELTIPAAMEGGVRGVSADLSITGTRGRMRATSLSGQVLASNVTGPTRLETLGGAVHVQKASGSLEIFAPAGNVTVTDMHGAIRVRSVSGDVTLDHVSLNAMDLESYRGAIHVTGTLEKRGQYAAKSFDGNVVLTLAHATGLRARVDAPHGHLAFPNTFNFTGDVTKQRGTLVFGDEGIRIRAESFRGDVVLVQVSP